MLPQAADFRAEADSLYQVLLTLHEADWNRVTLFKGWTVNDVVQHLHAGDLMAAASVAGPEPFAALQAEVRARRESGMSRVEETRDRLGGLVGAPLRERWYTRAISLADELGAMPPDARLKWSGPDMGVRMFATARQMETWAHGQEIHDVMGIHRASSDRLRNIAEIGVRTYGWTFANRGRPVPGPAPHVRLMGPSGAIWEWNTPCDDNAIVGDAVQFCQVVTQTRNVADTALAVVGEPARIWMSLAQCFAGPPEDPPAPGTRFAAPASTPR